MIEIEIAVPPAVLHQINRHIRWPNDGQTLRGVIEDAMIKEIAGVYERVPIRVILGEEILATFTFVRKEEAILFRMRCP